MQNISNSEAQFVEINRRLGIILVGRDSEVTGQWSLFPSQSVIDPPAPSITGTNDRKSYGCTTE
jgi:hypothetical protein